MQTGKLDNATWKERGILLVLLKMTKSERFEARSSCQLATKK